MTSLPEERVNSSALRRLQVLVALSAPPAHQIISKRAQDAPAKSWKPDQAGVVGSSVVRHEIPIFQLAEARCVAVQETKISSTAVQIRMHIVFLGDSREFAVVEKPHRSNRVRN